MSNLIVNGYTGSAHVRSYDQQGLCRGLFGSGCYVLDTEDAPFEALLPTASGMYIGPGEGVIQGVHFRVEPGSQQSISFDAGAAGYNRIDLVVARYTMNVATKVESVEFVVIKGSPAAGTPAVPVYNTINIGEQQNAAESGVLTCDFPLYTVRFTGTALTSVTQQFSVLKSMSGGSGEDQRIYSTTYRLQYTSTSSAIKNLRLRRCGNIVQGFFEVVDTAPQKNQYIGCGTVPTGYTPILAAEVYYGRVANAAYTPAVGGKFVVQETGGIVHLTNTTEMSERIVSTTWITADEYPE